jgi:hypothetical protein
MEHVAQTSQVLSTKDWLITLIITIIPIVNIIMFFVWAFGDGTNPNKANWAKASLLLTAIIAVLYVVLVLIIFGAMLGSGSF